MISNYRVNFGGDEIDYKNNFKDCRQYFPILQKLYTLMNMYDVEDSWHFFEPYVEFTWVCDQRLVMEAVLTLLRKEGIELEKVKQNRDVLLKALNWVLGADGDFKQKPDNAGNYWWRTELVERANLIWDSDKLTHIQKIEKLKC